MSPALTGAPRLVVGAPSYSEGPQELALLGTNTLLKLTHLSLHSTSSQTLLEASSD